ncbi:PREDICTED: T-cell surface glycoprotein CD1e, membrane-associated isoform X10 [Rhinopithecus bieti]|uniref:T-cell surface glycoprotein CD1e, membrane-associated isoform X10 n=1 Tax=Rhinopithecus bieti TaxID=61621 RepID=UPI00083C14A4|nr:PREDICTED: T-cell surface glycoprotein CD1e, membrane-associated isoform X10 [Rhinopithecus bieti]
MLLLFLLFEGLCCPGENTAVKPEAWLSRGPSPGPGRLQLVCHVSGFYPKPMWVMWMRGGYSVFLILICLTVIVNLVILIVVDLWLKKQSSNKNVLSPRAPSPVFSMGDNTRDTNNSRHHFCLAQVSWIKNRFLKWKTRLNQLS